MKNFPKVFSAFFVLAVAFFLASCTGHEAEQPQTAFGEETIALVYGDAPYSSSSSQANVWASSALTKGRVFTQDGSFVWDDGDEISIWFDDNQYRTYTVSSGVVSKPSESANRTNYAIYPSSAAPAASSAYSGSTPNVIYGTTYTISGSDNETASQMPLLAENIEGNKKLVFYHVGGLMRLKMNGVPSHTKSVKVEFEKSNITGTFAVNVPKDASGNIQPVTTGTGTGKSVVFNFSGTPNQISYLNIPLPAGSYESETITVTLYDGADATGNTISSDSSSPSFTSTIDLGTIGRRTGRIFGISLFGVTAGVRAVEISGDILGNPSTGSGTLYLYDTPFEAQLNATVQYISGTSFTDNSLVTWTSSDPCVSVHAGKITARTTGTATITATSIDDGTKSASVTITVESNSPTSSFTPMAFSVSDSHTVEFSPGNLQATIRTSGSVQNAEWRFATHQYEYIGPISGTSFSFSVDSSIDLFVQSGADNDTYRYGLFPASYENYMGTTKNEFIDWGKNSISYRAETYAPNAYRTPTVTEMQYILEKRTGSKAGTVGAATNCRFSMVTVEGVFGMLIYPDGFLWDRSTMGTMPQRFNVYSPSCGVYSGSNWAALENAGVVFLPAAGLRIKADSDVISGAGSAGYYQLFGSVPLWANSNGVQRGQLEFASSAYSLGLTTYYERASAVRLVKDGTVNVRRVDFATKSIQLDNDNPQVNNLSATVLYMDGSTAPATIEVVSTSTLNAAYNKPAAISLTENSTAGSYTLSRGTYGTAVLVAKAGSHYSEYCFVGSSDGYFHLSDGTKVEIAPGNLQAHMTNDIVDTWRMTSTPFALADYSGGINENFPQNDTKRTGTGWIDLFDATMPSVDNRYGVDLNYHGGEYVDWGGLSIQKPGSTETYPVNYWRTPSVQDWYDILNYYTYYQEQPGYSPVAITAVAVKGTIPLYGGFAYGRLYIPEGVIMDGLSGAYITGDMQVSRRAELQNSALQPDYLANKGSVVFPEFGAWYLDRSEDRDGYITWVDYYLQSQSLYSVACAARWNATAGDGTVYDIGARGTASDSIALVRLIRNVD